MKLATLGFLLTCLFPAYVLAVWNCGTAERTSQAQTSINNLFDAMDTDDDNQISLAEAQTNNVISEHLFNVLSEQYTKSDGFITDGDMFKFFGCSEQRDGTVRGLKY